jgi:hypothetical protein
MYMVANIPQIQSISNFNLISSKPVLTACVLPVFVLPQAWFTTSPLPVITFVYLQAATLSHIPVLHSVWNKYYSQHFLFTLCQC